MDKTALLLTTLLTTTFSLPAFAQQEASEFAKSSAGERAPQAPKTLDCPEGAELRSRKEELHCWAKGKDPHGFHGPRVTLYPNGQVRTINTYENSQLVGVVKRYDREGLIQAKESYRADKLHGPEAQYQGGKLLIESERVDGKLHGTSRGFRADGTLRKIEVHRDGARVSEDVFHKNGKLQSRTTLEGELRRFETFREDGTRASTFLYRGAEEVGATSYGPDGETVTRATGLGTNAKPAPQAPPSAKAPAATKR